MGHQGTRLCLIELIGTAHIQAAGSILYPILDLLYENRSKTIQSRTYLWSSQGYNDLNLHTPHLHFCTFIVQKCKTVATDKNPPTENTSRKHSSAQHTTDWQTAVLQTASIFWACASQNFPWLHLCKCMIWLFWCPLQCRHCVSLCGWK